MTILRDLLRKVPFPIKFRVAKLLFRLGFPVLKRFRLLDELATPPETMSRLAAAKNRDIEILVVLDRLPLPAKDAARVRMLAILKILTQFAGVTLIPLYHRFANSDHEKAVRELGIEIVGVFDLESVLDGRYFDIALMSYPHVADYMMPVIRREFPEANVIFDTVDVQFIRLRREAEVKDSRSIGREAEKIRLIETRLANSADQTWCVTSDDREFLLAEATAAKIKVVPNIHAVNNRGPVFEERSGLLFIGNFEHRPNVDAVNWLLDEILPLAGDEGRKIKLHIVGGGIPPAMAGRRSENVILHGFTENVEPFYRQCRLVVAPLRFGGGMKGKIGEAMSFGVPVVTTAIGAEGFGLIDGREALIADEAAGFAANILRAYHNKEMWQTLSDNGLSYIDANLSPKMAETHIREAFDALLPERGVSQR
ncbi:MAG: glycosyltransferase [Acidobacteria bacterium]|nr:glycosyltransferase [Acidobacteriota bacterium]